MSDSMKPWEAGYVTPEAPPALSAAERGRNGGLKAQARKREGLPAEAKGDGTGKQGRKRTSPERQEAFDAMTEETLPLKKKLFLDRFIGEYLHDFNSSMAWIRAGGAMSHATTGGPESLRTAYVQTQIRMLAQTMEQQQIITASEVLLGLKREANYTGEDGSSASRVRAWGMLGQMLGMDKPKTKDPEDNRPAGGVMEIPVYTDVQWEQAAATSQLQLKNDVRN